MACFGEEFVHCTPCKLVGLVFIYELSSNSKYVCYIVRNIEFF